jgi:hypothetical protein
MKTNGLSWQSCVSICTDGAPSMAGSLKGFLSCVKAINKNIISTHCFLHHKTLVTKIASQDTKCLKWIIKSSRATSCVRWLSEDKANISRTISVLVFRSLMCLEKHSTPGIGLHEFQAHVGMLANGSCQLVSRICCVRPDSWLDSMFITGCLARLNMRRGVFLQTHQWPEDEDRDGPRNVGFFFT